MQDPIAERYDHDVSMVLLKGPVYFEDVGGDPKNCKGLERFPEIRRVRADTVVIPSAGQTGGERVDSFRRSL